jgi:hypothetical protein
VFGDFFAQESPQAGSLCHAGSHSLDCGTGSGQWQSFGPPTQLSD